MTDFPETLITLLREAQHVVVLTGAGVSAESGVPTFRDALTGLWAKYDPTELATPEAFARDPALVWNWYLWRRNLVRGVSPNPGHVALVRMQQLIPRLTLITQNVDSLHQTAGSQNVVELHGNLTRARCANCGRVAARWPEETAEVPPRCTHCHGRLRPDVVWFGESLPTAELQKAFEAASHCDVFFSVGTSALVQPAASLPLEALSRGTAVVEINPSPTPLTRYADIVLTGPSGVILPDLIARTWPERSQ